MSVAPLLSRLQALDVRVWADGDQLRCDAVPGTLTDELRAELRQRKAEIVAFLRLAERLAAPQGAIVPLQPKGDAAPVFAVAHHGDVFYYQTFARTLGEERAFFALNPPGVDGSRAPLARVEDLADYFAAEMCAFRPRGPRIVAGYCMGAAVAFELAQRLLVAGEPAVFLVLFGAPDPAFFRPLNMLRERLKKRAGLWRARARLLAAQSGRERLEYFAWRLRRFAVPDPAVVRTARVDALTERSVRSYVPRSFPGRVHHFIPSAEWARRREVRAERWQRAAPLLESYYGPPGCTHDDMLQDRNADVFARQLRRICALEGV